MTQTLRVLLSAGLISAVLPVAAHATPLTLSGNYLEVGISDYGTFGSNGSTQPGILHDPSGTKNFYPGGVANDYLTPGTPHDGFAINSSQTGFIVNDNYGVSSFGMFSPTLLTGAAAKGFDFAATWSGSYADALDITNSYFFNANSQIIHVETTVLARTDLTNVAFGRSEDPDPDVNRFGSYDTVNTRGDMSHAASELVSGAGPQTGLTIGILNESGDRFDHNTGISTNCCGNDDPNSVLSGYGPVFSSTNLGDYGLQMAWLLGDMTAGQSFTINYAYIFANDQANVSSVPLPAALPLFSTVVIGGLGGARLRRKKQQAQFRRIRSD